MATVERPDLPEIDSDWDARTWHHVGEQAVELVIRASTDWDHRPPAPTDWDHRPPAPTVPAHDVTEHFRGPLPQKPVELDVLLARLRDEVIPLSTFNGHPRFFGYITSSPNPAGVVGDFIASAINANTALWRAAPAATAIELQTIEWLKELLGLPASTEGIFSRASSPTF